MLMEWTQRTEALLGHTNIITLNNAHILVVGVGGVGGAAIEMLARAGVGKFTLIDNDLVSITNINRQLIANHTTVGQTKVDVWKERLLSINPHIIVNTNAVFLDENNVASLLNEDKFDFVVDAIDTLSPKVQLLAACHQNGINVISSMGSGSKMDPACIRLADISKTAYCPLARSVRGALSKKGIKNGIPCVYSIEQPIKQGVIPVEGERNKKSTTGTISYMPNLFGCWMAAYVINSLTKDISHD